MRVSDCPMVFWDYCAERWARVNNLTARQLFQLQGQNPYLATLGEEGDISNLCQFEWYAWAHAQETSAKFPHDSQTLVRVLGPCKNAGNEMAQWCLKANGHIVPRRSVFPLTTAQLNSDVEIRKRQEFDQKIRARYGDSLKLPPVPLTDTDFVPYEDDENKP